jgi:hypothetical protein
MLVQDGVKELAAHIIKVDINSLGCHLRNGVVDAHLFVVEHVIVMQLVFAPVDFVVTTN